MTSTNEIPQNFVASELFDGYWEGFQYQDGPLGKGYYQCIEPTSEAISTRIEPSQDELRQPSESHASVSNFQRFISPLQSSFAALGRSMTQCFRSQVSESTDGSQHSMVRGIDFDIESESENENENENGSERSSSLTYMSNNDSQNLDIELVDFMPVASFFGDIEGFTYNEIGQSGAGYYRLSAETASEIAPSQDHQISLLFKDLSSDQLAHKRSISRPSQQYDSNPLIGKLSICPDDEESVTLESFRDLLNAAEMNNTSIEFVYFENNGSKGLVLKSSWDANQGKDLHSGETLESHNIQFISQDVLRDYFEKNQALHA